MIDHNKIENAIDNYFQNTPTAKIIENLDRHAIDRQKDLDRENIDCLPVNNKVALSENLVRFEDVSPANRDAAFVAVSIESLVAPLGLPIYDGYDDLDYLQLTFLTLPSGETVTLASYLNSPQPGTFIHVDSAIQNIPHIIFESCQQLQVSREEVLWFNPDWQEEIDALFETLRERLYPKHVAIQKRAESSPIEESPQKNRYEPIDCFKHALRIYPRADYPDYWAMLQHNLGLAYANRSQRHLEDNYEKSIECFYNSLQIYTQDDFPEKWEINQQELNKVQKIFKLEVLRQQSLDKHIIFGRRFKDSGMHDDLCVAAADLKFADLSRIYIACLDLRFLDMTGINLSGARLQRVRLNYAKLSGANLSGTRFISMNAIGVDFSNANLSNANLSGVTLSGANLDGANVNNTKFNNDYCGLSKFVKQDLMLRGAIFV